MADSGGTPQTPVSNNPGQFPKQPVANPVKANGVDSPMPGTFNPPGYSNHHMGAPDVAHTGVPT